MKGALILTLARLVICPVFLVTYLFYGQMGLSVFSMSLVLLFLLTLCELSDAFDGVLARRSNQVTTLGKILDPMADSIVRLSILVVFTRGLINLPVLLVLVFVFRDAIISMLRTLAALSGKALAARKSGKLKAILQAVSIYVLVCLMLVYSGGWISLSTLREVSFWTVVVTAIYTVASGVEYLWTCRDYIRDAWVTAR